MIITILLILILIVLVYNYYVHYGRNGKLINLIPGPPGYLIVGNIAEYLSSQEKLWKLLTTVTQQYYPITKIWIFFKPFVFICHPDDLKTILKSAKHIEKSFIYDGLRPWLGTNILTSGGAKWHSRRKMLTSTLHFNKLQQFAVILIEEGENMTKSLKNTGGTIVKDLIPFFGEHTLYAICETAMGYSLRNDSNEFQQQYRKAVDKIGKIFVYRTLRQWLRNNWIFSLTTKGKEQAKLLKTLHGFTDQIIQERKLYHEYSKDRIWNSFDSVTSADDVEMSGTQKRRLTLLDLLITSFQKGLLTDSDIKDEVNTFMFAGHDTTAIALSYLLMLLAEHKDIQDYVRKEVDSVMEMNEGKLTMKSLQELKYLERTIKESLRLYPSADIISRVTGEDVKLQSYVVPAGTTVFLNIYAVHRDPNFWPNPEVFDPDRFLSERTRNRHSFSYIPFSAGPRNCLGKLIRRFFLIFLYNLI